MRFTTPYDKSQNYERAFRIARHECGHYVVARALGFRTGFISVELTFPGGHSGKSEITLLCPLNSVAEICSYLERRIQVLYAGVVAEALEGGRIDEQKVNGYIKTGADQDFAKIRELANILANLRRPANALEDAQRHLDEFCSELRTNVMALVLKEQQVIEGLARRLASGLSAFSSPYTLSATELETLPALVERFGASETFGGATPSG